MILQSLDYSGIEARVTAWLFGEEWKLQAFRDFDAGTGEDLYKLAYARAFRVHVKSVTKQQRQIGKVMELAFGYEGGVGAFVTMAGTYGVDLDEMAAASFNTLPSDAREHAEWCWREWAVPRRQTHSLREDTYIVCKGVNWLWRQAHPRIKEGWPAMRDAAMAAVENPDKVYAIHGGRIKFALKGDWLYMRLPSNRRLAYYKPMVEYDYSECSDCAWLPCPNPNCKTSFVCDLCTPYRGRGVPSDPECPTCSGSRKIPNPRSARLTYMGIDTYSRQWGRTGTYGGKLTENAVQAIARDVMVSGLWNLERAGYKTVATIHDEIVSEIPEDFGSLEEARKLMAQTPPWAAGLPIATEGFRAKRYRK